MEKIDLTVAGYIINKNKVLLILHKKLNLWLPVGGHIDSNETPDMALHREIFEEVGLKIKILCNNSLPIQGNIKYNTAIPFYTNVHSVGDHLHYGMYFVCELLDNKVEINMNEILNFKWFDKEELNKSSEIPEDVKAQCFEAFKFYSKFKN